MSSRINKVMYSSMKQDYETPQPLFNKLNEEFHFTLDAAANADNLKVDNYIDEAVDALRVSWFDCSRFQSLTAKPVVWLNPPYNNIAKFMEKAYQESEYRGCTVVCLIPARTDTKWWHKFVMKADEIRFIPGRLKFSGNENSAPFPSCIVIFRPEGEKKFMYNVPVITPHKI